MSLVAEASVVQVRLNKKGKPSIIRWQGLLCGIGRQIRVMIFFALVVLAASMTFTQLGFIRVGVSEGYVGYMVALLVPVAIGALLLGVWPGALLGLISGCVLFLHSHAQPLDYYEVSFVTHLSSIVLFFAIGFLIGLFLAIALRKNPPRVKRVVYIAIVCLVSSLMFTALFMVNVFIQLMYSMIDMVAEAGGVYDEEAIRAYAAGMLMRMGSPDVQIELDALLMFVSCVLADLAAHRMLAQRAQHTAGLSGKFNVWLLLVVSLAFVITAGFSFIVITVQAIDNAKSESLSEIDYLINQLKAYDSRLDALVQLTKNRENVDDNYTDEEIKSLETILSVDNLLQGYSKEEDGTIVVFLDGYVMLSNDPEYEVGSMLNDYNGMSDIAGILKDSSNEGEMLQLTYDETMIMKSDLQQVDNYYSEKTTDPQIVYLCYKTYDDYTVMIIKPATMVFASRSATMLWTTVLALVLLLVVFVLVSRLLNVLVKRRIDETNKVLGEITDGNLNARVNVDDPREFASLAEGINSTVDALKGWISEAETRMDAELSTAKAIQESALPRTFPPFPDIHKFDVYATMRAAKEVGGDFYDFFLIGDDSTSDSGKLGFVIADVSGKGVPAALFMMKAKTQLRDYLDSGMEIGEAVENANRQLCDGNDAGMFVTVWVGVLDYGTGRVEYVNAGHNPPLLWQKETGWRWIEDKSGMPLGLFDGFPYEAFSVNCGIGDQFLLYTDGVTEAMNVDGELYGEDRLKEIADMDFVMHPRSLVNAVRHSVTKHANGAEQSDDITMLALEVGVPPEVTATLIVPADVGELPRVNEFIHTELDRRLCPLRAQKQLDIAVEELFVNVAHYAYPDATADNPGMVRIGYSYSAEPPSVRVSIADDGVPYNPLAKPDAVTPDDIMEVPIGGLGILMAKNSVDDMTYERVDESNVVTIMKKW